MDKPLEEQGPFDCILHKLTDYIAQAESGDHDAECLISSILEYGQKHPRMLIIDSIVCLRNLINRFKTYSIIDNATTFTPQRTYFVPKFVALQTKDFDNNKKLLHKTGVTYPAGNKNAI